MAWPAGRAPLDCWQGRPAARKGLYRLQLAEPAPELAARKGLNRTMLWMIWRHSNGWRDSNGRGEGGEIRFFYDCNQQSQAWPQVTQILAPIYW